MAVLAAVGFVVALGASAYYRIQALRHRTPGTSLWNPATLSDAGLGPVGVRYWRRHLIAGAVAIALSVVAIVLWPK